MQRFESATTDGGSTCEHAAYIPATAMQPAVTHHSLYSTLYCPKDGWLTRTSTVQCEATAVGFLRQDTLLSATSVIKRTASNTVHLVAHVTDLLLPFPPACLSFQSALLLHSNFPFPSTWLQLLLVLISTLSARRRLKYTSSASRCSCSGNNSVCAFEASASAISLTHC